MIFGQTLSEGVQIQVMRKAEVVSSHSQNKHWKAASAKQDTEVTHWRSSSSLTEKMQEIYTNLYKIQI